MSFRICLIIFVLALFVSGVAHGQDSLKYSGISLSIGLNKLSNKDAFQSPYTYKGTNLLLNFMYTRAGRKGEHIVDVTYSGGQIKSVVSPEADNQLFLFYYDYLFNLRTKNVDEKFTPSLGIGVHSLLSNTNYLPDVEGPVSYLSGGAFLTFSGNILYRLNKKSSVRIQAGLPVFGFVYRPDFEINGKTLTKTTGLGNGNLFSVKVEYDYKLSSKLYLTASYSYNYFSFDEPRAITILTNGLLVGLRKTF
jgi:hypothetical protein